MRRLHALQYLRIIAALVVVYSHSTLQVAEWQSLLPDTGTYGVDIFFVISGFIMVYITKAQDTPSNFLIKRIQRVVPLYWFFTLLMAAILFFIPTLFKSGEFNWVAVFQSLFFIPHYSLQNPDYVWPIVAPGWSLNYEMYFYSLFAFSLFFAPQFRVAIVTCIITVVWAIFEISGSTVAIPRFVSDPSVFEFIAGMLLAVAWKRGFTMSSNAGWVCVVIGFAGATFLPEELHHWIHISIPSALIVVGFLYINVPISRIGLMLGDASYAVYLSHIFVLGALRVLVPDNVTSSAFYAWGFVLACIVASTLTGIVVHYLIDNWLLRKERLNVFRSAAQEANHS